MNITIDITDEAKAALDRLAELVERLERVLNRPDAPSGPCGELPAEPAEGALAAFEPVGVEDLAYMPDFNGRGAVSKGAIWGRMARYRMARGLGCWAPLAKELHKSDDWVRSVYLGEIAVPLAVWRKIDHALDRLGAPPVPGKGAGGEDGR